MANAHPQPGPSVGWWAVLSLSLYLGAVPWGGIEANREVGPAYWVVLAARSAAAGALSGVAALVLARLWKPDRGSRPVLVGYALTFGVAFALAGGTFAGTRNALEPALGALAARAVGLAAGIVAGSVVGLTLGRLLKLPRSGST